MRYEVIPVSPLPGGARYVLGTDGDVMVCLCDLSKWDAATCAEFTEQWNRLAGSIPRTRETEPVPQERHLRTVAA